MDDPKTLHLVKELVTRLLSSSSSSSSLPPSDPNNKPSDLQKALRYAHLLLSSSMSPSISVDESAMAESIKRHLVNQGRSADALTFAGLYTQFSARSGPGSIQNRWSLLYLIKSISEDRKKSQGGLILPRVSFSSSISGALPALPLDSYLPRAPRKNLAAGGVLTISKDPDNIREIALREYADLVREEMMPISESALVTDVLYAVQAIDGRYVRYSSSVDGYDFPDPVKVPRSTRTMVRKLSELGWLFRKVKGYISDSTDSFQAEEIGTVGQAFCAALEEELSEYYKLLAVLKSQSCHAIPLGISDAGGPPPGNYLSLRRLMVWLAEPTVRMRLMAVLVDGCKSLRGGSMAGAIHSHAQHGDPLVKEFMGRLLRRVCSPLFEMVRSWVLEGELDDLFAEFFIISQPVKAESLWREGYQIKSSMLPSFISQTLARRILRAGKSINFLRVCCEDSGWAEAAAEAAALVGTSTRRGSLGYGETDALEALVIEAGRRIDKHLMDVMHQRYRFKDHCLAIKRYLLLGQGDFVQYLMDVVGPELSEPANTISSFQLSGLLESAIRASNAQYDDRDILDRLNVKMMDHGDGDRGWDVFSLEYKAGVPLDTVFTASVMKRYLRIFNFLWQLRRVEHALTGVWKTMKPNCIISRLFPREGATFKLQFVSALRRCQVLWNEMNHFVTNFQYYIMFEVLEVSWARFVEEMDAAKDLDDLLAAHEKYLNSIVEKSLLGEKSQEINRVLFTLFNRILRFRSNADRWFERIYELQPRGRSKSKVKSKDDLSKLGSWIDGGRKALTQLAKEFLKRMGEELDTNAKEYSSSLKSFISLLPVQQHVDLKFLLFRLDFTEYYSQLSHSR